MVMPDIKIYETGEELALTAAEYVIDIGQAAIESGGRFSIVLAGGSTPRPVYQLLASEAFNSRLDWNKVHVFWGDERPVPPDHPDSNFGMAEETLLSNVSIPASNIYRMKGEVPPQDAAREYEKELRRFFSDQPWPQFNLILLGMGDDGHTASLFPNTAALHETERWVAANPVEKLSTTRITLTVPAINTARHVLFLVKGENKAEPLKAVLEGPQLLEKLPSQRIQPAQGKLVWMVDKSAASQLEAG
jgi:6-phosphogluconolactonase